MPFIARARGAWARGLAFAILLFALAGPLLVHETHAALPDVVAVIVDRSQSMGLGDPPPGCRQGAGCAAAASWRPSPDLIVREASVTTTSSGENNGTQAFAALNAVLGDVPPSRVAGAILITDGQIHDAPDPSQLQLHAPLQGLIAGKRGERDRKLTIVNAARFAIVGQSAQMIVRVEDFGGPGGDSTDANFADISISRGWQIAGQQIGAGRQGGAPFHPCDP